MKILLIHLAYRNIFEEIEQGKKKEHYVEIRQPWINRAAEKYDAVHFKIGTGKEFRRELMIEYKGMTVKEVMNDKTLVSQRIFAIQLGEIIEKDV